MTKVAVGCRTLHQLSTRQAGRTAVREGVPSVVCQTRFMPKRAEELRGGSLFWIVKHALAGRQTILDFEMADTDRGKRCFIHLGAEVVPVLAAPLRAHQGWRYLEGEAAPPDLAGLDGDLGALPLKMMRDLRGLGLI